MPLLSFVGEAGCTDGIMKTSAKCSISCHVLFDASAVIIGEAGCTGSILKTTAKCSNYSHVLFDAAVAICKRYQRCLKEGVVVFITIWR